MSIEKYENDSLEEFIDRFGQEKISQIAGLVDQIGSVILKVLEATAEGIVVIGDAFTGSDNSSEEQNSSYL